jgi:hypothetical protein
MRLLVMVLPGVMGARVGVGVAPVEVEAIVMVEATRGVAVVLLPLLVAVPGTDEGTSATESQVSCHQIAVEWTS